MKNPLSLLDQVVSDLDRVLSADGFGTLSDADRMDVLRVAGDAFRRIEAVIVETTASAESGFSDQCGCRNMNELLQRVLRVDAPGAARVVKAADLVHRDVELTSGAPLPARWPALREAMRDGTIGIAGLLAATGPIDRAGVRIGLADRLRADAELAHQARGYALALAGVDADVDVDADAWVAEPVEGSDPAETTVSDYVAPPATPEDLKQFAQLVAMYLDPDGSAPSAAEASQVRSFTVGRLRNGTYPVRGNLLPEVYAQLQLLFDAQLNPKTAGPTDMGVQFRPSDEIDGAGDGGSGGVEDPFNSDPRNVIDPRTRPQKQHDALASALGIAARHEDMPSLGGAAPTLVVHVDAKDFAEDDRWATIPGIDTPVSATVASHTACTGTVQRVLFDEGRIIGISVTDRVFTVHQRRAIVLRDKECLIPGCHVPASWCEIHHVIEHARGGPTHTDNGVPLCWHHHRTLDTSGWEIRTVNGIPQIRGPGWWDPAQQWRTPRPTLSTLTHV
ncbi:HNH endonuclease signature motif containing protein [Microbacterium aurantiacum]|uniref:HNH endonuclease signature motif containing protein n=1 Tax=Microbacterium aurantiacum TaxID=162393 RepID=UPI000C7FBDCF|nr:HNH endonuclease signature motif containing protein [Microbacterium aurantiacum]